MERETQTLVCIINALALPPAQTLFSVRVERECRIRHFLPPNGLSGNSLVSRLICSCSSNQISSLYPVPPRSTPGSPSGLFS